MATTNPITGDRMVSKAGSLASDAAFDLIFGKKERKTVVIKQCPECGRLEPCNSANCFLAQDEINGV